MLGPPLAVGLHQPVDGHRLLVGDGGLHLGVLVGQHARRDARADDEGRLVPLPDQNPSRWRPDEIEQGLARLARLGATPTVCDYHLQVLIAGEHAMPGDTDWPRIARLYAELERRNGSPVVRLNRAVAVAEACNAAAPGPRLADREMSAVPKPAL
jgi:RNA polymerase sigma-70 factor (ECF subfamily)